MNRIATATVLIAAAIVSADPYDETKLDCWDKATPEQRDCLARMVDGLNIRMEDCKALTDNAARLECIRTVQLDWLTGIPCAYCLFMYPEAHTIQPDLPLVGEWFGLAMAGDPAADLNGDGFADALDVGWLVHGWEVLP